MKAIKSVIYVSTANADLSDNDLDVINTQSLSNNPRLSLTGVLGYNGSNFMQLLEGPSEKVFQILGVIKQDSRHTNMVVISQRDMAAREFGAWAMLYSRYKMNGSEPGDELKAWLDSNNVSSETNSMFASFESLGMAGR